MPNLTWMYVAAAYAVAIALARLARVRIPWRTALFFYAIVLVFFFPVLARDEVNVSTDVLGGLPPWTYLRSDPGSLNGELNDLPLQIVPWAHLARESWRSLRVPLWNPFSGCGYPLLANGQSSALSPLRILTLPLSLGHAMAAEGALKVLAALTFMYLYCRRRYGELGSVIAAISFGFSGFIVGWLHFPIVTAACLAPAMLYCINLLAERRTYGRFLFAVAVAVAIVFAGHPETAAHLALLAIGYVSWMLWVERPADVDRKRLLLALAGVVAVAMLVAAPYLAVVAEAVPRSARYDSLQRTPFPATVGYATWQCAVMLLQPHFFGRTPLEQAWQPADTEPLGGYAGALAIAAWLATFIDAIARRQLRSRELFYALGALCAGGVIFNWPLVSQALHAILPLMAHARVRLLFALLVSIQTAAATEAVRRKPALIGIALVSVLLLVLLDNVRFPTPAWRDTALLTMLPSLAVLAIATVAVLTRHRLAYAALIAAILVELFAIGRNRNPFIPGDLMYPRTPLVDALHALQRTAPANAPFRIAGVGGVLYPNTQSVFGFEDIRAHDPMANGRYLDFMELAGGLDVHAYHPWWEKNIELPSLDFLNVRYIAGYRNTVMHEQERFRLVWEGPDGVIFENRHVLPRFYAVRNVILIFNRATFRRRLQQLSEWSQTAVLDELKIENRRMEDDFFRPRPTGSPLANATIVEAKPDEYRLHVSAPRYSLVVSSVAWWPDWRVERNGRRVEPIRVNGAFLGFAVPPGESDVRVWYAPASFRLGAIASLLTLAALAAIGFRRRFRRTTPS
jgi:hypothetical protein